MNLKNFRRPVSLAVAVALTLSLFSLPAEAAAKKPTFTSKMQLGQLLYFNGNVDAAIKAFEYAAYLKPEAFEPHLNLVNLYVQRGGDDGISKAVESCKKVLAIKPNHKDVHLILGNLLRTQAGSEKSPEAMNAKLDEAIKSLETAQELGASEALVENTKGLILLQQGKHTDALTHIEKAIEKQANFPDAHLVRGVLLFRKATDGKEAAKVLAEVDKDPELKKKIDEVMSELDISIKQKGKNAEAHNTKGDIYYAMGKFEESAAEYKKATDDEPRYGQAWAGIGNAKVQLKDISGAKDAYRRAKEIRPDDKNIIYGLAVMLEKSGEVNGAIQEFNDGLMLETDPMMRAQIQQHIQQLMGGGQMAGFGGIGGIGGGGFGGGPIYNPGPLQQDFSQLIKISGKAEKEEKHKEAKHEEPKHHEKPSTEKPAGEAAPAPDTKSSVDEKTTLVAAATIDWEKLKQLAASGGWSGAQVDDFIKVERDKGVTDQDIYLKAMEHFKKPLVSN